jgi:peptidyl-prolyl cis-trans isomerase SurA
MRNKPFTQFVFSILLVFASRDLSGQEINDIWDPPFKHGIAAVVEDRIITYEELRREMAPLIGQLRQHSRTAQDFERQMEELYFDVLGNLVDRILIVKDFYSEEERKIPRSFIDNEFNRILIEDFNNDRRKFLENLRAEGKSARDFRKDLEENIIVSVMRGQMRKSQSEISPEKIEEFYNENKIHFFQEEKVHLRLIMLKPLADESPDLLRQNADRIMSELDAGADFAETARNYSQDSRRDRGGDWGWINRADLRGELSEAAFALEPRAYSRPIELAGQIFMLYLENRREENIQSLDLVRDRIESILSGQLAREAQGRWLERLRKNSYIKYY